MSDCNAPSADVSHIPLRWLTREELSKGEGLRSLTGIITDYVAAGCKCTENAVTAAGSSAQAEPITAKLDKTRKERAGHWACPQLVKKDFFDKPANSELM